MPTLSEIFGGGQSADTPEPDTQLATDDGFDASDDDASSPEVDPGVGQPVEPPPFDPDPDAAS